MGPTLAAFWFLVGGPRDVLEKRGWLAALQGGRKLPWRFSALEGCMEHLPLFEPEMGMLEQIVVPSLVALPVFAAGPLAGAKCPLFGPPWSPGRPLWVSLEQVPWDWNWGPLCRRW